MKLFYPITVDLYKPYPLPVMPAQEANAGRGALITLTALGAVITPTDETINLYAKRPDGNISYLPCTLSGSEISCEFTNQMLSVPGIVDVELQMVSGSEGTEITTPIFRVIVGESNIDPSAVESSNEFTALATALAEVEELKSTGLKGDKGDKGDQGEQGEAATIKIGTVVTGTEAAVTNSGTENDAVLDFTLPKGDQGAQGESGVLFAAKADFPATGDSSLLYVDTSVTPHVIYSWDGSSYVETGNRLDRTVTLSATGWSGTEAPYTQTVTVADMEEDTAAVYAQVTADALPTDAETTAYGLLMGKVQGAGSVTFYAAAIPEIDIQVRIFDGGGNGEGEVVSNEIVMEAYADFPTTGSTGILYIDTASTPNKIYTWDGTTYVLAGGESSGQKSSRVTETTDTSKYYKILEYDGDTATDGTTKTYAVYSLQDLYLLTLQYKEGGIYQMVSNIGHPGKTGVFKVGRSGNVRDYFFEPTSSSATEIVVVEVASYIPEGASDPVTLIDGAGTGKTADELTEEYTTVTTPSTMKLSTRVSTLETKVSTLETRLSYGIRILYVSTEGSDATGDGTSDNPYATITRAIAAYSGYAQELVIYVSAGTYDNAVAIPSNPLLQRVKIAKKSGDSGTVTIQRIQFSGPKLELDDLTIDPTNASTANGVYCEGEAYIRNCIFVGSDGKYGISAQKALLTVSDCTFSGFTLAAIYLWRSDAYLYGCTGTDLETSVMLSWGSTVRQAGGGTGAFGTGAVVEMLNNGTNMHPDPACIDPSSYNTLTWGTAYTPTADCFLVAHVLAGGDDVWTLAIGGTTIYTLDIDADVNIPVKAGDAILFSGLGSFFTASSGTAARAFAVK